MARSRRGRHEGAVYQRGDGRWEGKVSLGYDASGRRIRKCVYAKTKQELIDAIAEIRLAPPASAGAVDTKTTLAEFMPLWLAALRSQGKLRENTLTYYEIHVRKHAVPLHGMRIAKIQAHNVERTLNAIASARSREGTYDGLSSLFRLAKRRGLCVENPMETVPKPQRVKREHVRIWTLEEVRRFLEAARTSAYFGVYALALGASLRRGEIFALRWRDVCLEAGTVHVERTLIEVGGQLSFGPPKTERSARTVELPFVATEALRAKKKGAEDDLIFPDSCGGPMRRSNFDRRVHHPLLEHAGVPRRTLHECRHTHASVLLASGESIRLVSSRLGHSDIDVTLDVYAHLMPGADRSAAGKIDSAFATPQQAASKPALGHARHRPPRLRARRM